MLPPKTTPTIAKRNRTKAAAIRYASVVDVGAVDDRGAGAGATVKRPAARTAQPRTTPRWKSWFLRRPAKSPTCHPPWQRRPGRPPEQGDDKQGSWWERFRRVLRSSGSGPSAE